MSQFSLVHNKHECSCSAQLVKYLPIPKLGMNQNMLLNNTSLKK